MEDNKIMNLKERGINDCLKGNNQKNDESTMTCEMAESMIGAMKKIEETEGGIRAREKLLRQLNRSPGRGIDI